MERAEVSVAINTYLVSSYSPSVYVALQCHCYSLQDFQMFLRNLKEMSMNFKKKNNNLDRYATEQIYIQVWVVKMVLIMGHLRKVAYIFKAITFADDSIT